MHLIWSHRGVLLGHRCGNHGALGVRLRAIRLCIHGLTGPLRSLGRHAVLTGADGGVRGRHTWGLYDVRSLWYVVCFCCSWALCRRSWFVWPRPVIIEELLAVFPLLLQLLVELCSLCGLIKDLA